MYNTKQASIADSIKENDGWYELTLKIGKVGDMTLAPNVGRQLDILESYLAEKNAHCNSSIGVDLGHTFRRNHLNYSIKNVNLNYIYFETVSAKRGLQVDLSSQSRQGVQEVGEDLVTRLSDLEPGEEEIF